MHLVVGTGDREPRVTGGIAYGFVGPARPPSPMPHVVPSRSRAARASHVAHASVAPLMPFAVSIPGYSASFAVRV